MFSGFSLLLDGARFPLSSKGRMHGRRIFGILACLKMYLLSHLLHSLARFVELWIESYFPSSLLHCHLPSSFAVEMSETVLFLSLWSTLFLFGSLHSVPGALVLTSFPHRFIVWAWWVLVGWRLMFLHLDDIHFPSH